MTTEARLHVNTPNGRVSGGCPGCPDCVHAKPKPVADPVDHPSHYTTVVPGVECIDVAEHFTFLRGNAIKYLWRAGSKSDELEDLRKAAWYVNREIANLEGRATHGEPK